jgi:hypothetical protein
MTDKFLNNVLLILPICVAIVLWFVMGVKCSLLFYGMFSIGMYIHISITTLSNAFIGRTINASGDLFWKLLFLLFGCLFLSLFFLI